MNADIEMRWNQWKKQALKDMDLVHELECMQFDDEKIEDCFYKDLEFGTGGLRGIMGVGTNRINQYTIAKATQGYSNYLKRNYTDLCIAIAYDSRIKSDLFARVTAEILAANGIRVYFYPELMPTPALSFAIRHLHCSGGVVITASHNPAEYNGYKVYDRDGCQITTEAANEIWAEIVKIDIFTDIQKISFIEGIKQGLISYIKNETVQAFIDAVSSQLLCEDEKIDRDISIVYTPLNGAGLKCVLRCFRENGFTNISVVAEQEYSNGYFPTCPYPNPEIWEALELGLRDAKKQKSDLLLATDPDCDRIAIAVKSGENYALLSGNEVGLLMLDYVCKRRIARGIMPLNPVMIKTIVTTDMAKQIAQNYGVQVIEVLTGFKFIGERIGLLEQSGEEERFILGIEESCGYLTGSYVRDKDAVGGALLICEMAAYYKTTGQSLLDILNSLYEKYGYCLNTLHSYQFVGKSGAEKMKRTMERFRKGNIDFFAGKRVENIIDYQEQKTSSGNEKAGLFAGLPRSNVLKFCLEKNASIVVRPSGTEPKLKIYISVSSRDRQSAKNTEKEIVKSIEKLLE